MVFKIVRQIDESKETQDPYSNQILTETDPQFHSDLPEKPVDLNPIQSIVQNVGRLPVVAAEEALGTPRGFGDFGKAIFGDNPLSSLLGELPSSEEIRSGYTEPISQAITGQKGMLESRGDKAQIAENVVRTAVPFLLSGNAFKDLPKAAARALGIASSGEFTKWGSKKLGFGKGVQEGVKLATMLGVSWYGVPGSRSYAKKLYNSAKKNIPDESLVEFRPIAKQIQQARKGIRGGLGENIKMESKEFVQNYIEDLEGHLRPNGKTIPIKELFKTQFDYSELFGSGKVPKGAKNVIWEIHESFKEAYKTAPKSLQPFIAEHLNANDIWSATATSGKFSNMVKKYPKLSMFISSGSGVTGAAGLFLSKLMSPAGLGIKTGLAGATVFTGVKAATFIKNMVKHPGMRNYYASLMKSILSESASGVISNAIKLYNESEKVSKEESQKVSRKKSSTFRITRRIKT